MMLHQRQAFTCPCCKGYIGEAAPVSFVTMSLRGYQADIFSILSKRVGEPVPRQQIIDAIYRGDPNGGPLYAGNTVANHIKRLTAHIEPFGWTIIAGGRGRGVHGTYTLTPKEAGAC